MRAYLYFVLASCACLISCDEKNTLPEDPVTTITQASEFSWYPPSGDELNDDALVEDVSLTFPVFRDPFENLRKQLRDLFARLLHHSPRTSEDHRSFVELIIAIRNEDPQGLETTPALIAAYLEHPESDEGLNYVNLLGFLVSGQSVDFLRDLAISIPPPASPAINKDDCTYAPESIAIPAMIRLSATQNLYHIANLLESQEAQEHLFYVLQNSNLYMVRREAALLLRRLGANKDLIASHMIEEERQVLDFPEYDASLNLPVEDEFHEPYQEPESEANPNDPPSF